VSLPRSSSRIRPGLSVSDGDRSIARIQIPTDTKALEIFSFL
jgi:hypothetical protein